MPSRRQRVRDDRDADHDRGVPRLNPSTDRTGSSKRDQARTRSASRPATSSIPATRRSRYSDPGARPPARRLAAHPLWVTRYRDGELYAAGDYPNQGPAGTGLPQYVADHANVDGKDLVVWYTASFTHIPDVEDYPVMTLETVGFAIRPDGFFNENPALDAP